MWNLKKKYGTIVNIDSCNDLNVTQNSIYPTVVTCTVGTIFKSFGLYLNKTSVNTTWKNYR